MRLQESALAKSSGCLPKLVFLRLTSLCQCFLPHSLFDMFMLSISPGVLPGLTPSTRYIITVSACSPVGCTESLHNDNGDDKDLRSSLTTPEEGKALKHKHNIHAHESIHP